MKKYAIWDKVSPVITPIGEVLSAEQWIERYPVAGIGTITVVCSAGEINGGFFGTLGQMMSIYEAQGCDFSGCETPEEKLDRIEEFDMEKEAEAKAAAEAQAIAEAEAAEAEAEATERQTAALEAIASGQTAESTAAMNALLGEEE